MFTYVYGDIFSLFDAGMLRDLLAPLNYLFMGSVDVALTLVIAWVAWAWPRGTD